ncbi:hypothetical protein [Glycomyces xiaoerkulensis]|uniref:hypothetical protein n=1 Tax=Glycomyces xiaoerkulensis TaxID=2038139 RepID=UPI0012FFF1B2|nr:hypothetical protein [Glycomyces xiaoerkulensis]
MKNPARELHELITDWDDWQSRYTNDGFGEAVSDEGNRRWEARCYAIDLVREVDRALAGMAIAGLDVEVYRDCVASWYAVIFDMLKLKPNNVPELPPAELRMLKALASHLDSVRVGWSGEEVNYEELLEAIDEALNLLDETVLPVDEDHYIRALLSEAREVAAEVRKFGSATVRKITAELGGEILRLTGQVPEEKQQKRLLTLAGKFLRFGVQTFTGKALETAGSDTGQAAIQAITSGGTE